MLLSTFEFVHQLTLRDKLETGLSLENTNNFNIQEKTTLNEDIGDVFDNPNYQACNNQCYAAFIANNPTGGWMGNNPTYVNCSNNCYYQFSQ
jgi:hypothetical protein